MKLLFHSGKVLGRPHFSKCGFSVRIYTLIPPAPLNDANPGGFLLSPVLANYATAHGTIIVMTSSLPFKASGNTNPKNNWDRFDGDSTEPEWDIETDSDECEEDDYNSKEDN